MNRQGGDFDARSEMMSPGGFVQDARGLPLRVVHPEGVDQQMGAPLMTESSSQAVVSQGSSLASVSAPGQAGVTVAGQYSPSRGGQYSMPGDAAYRANPHVSMTDHRQVASPSRLVNSYEDGRVGGSPRGLITSTMSDYSRVVHNSRGSGSSGSSSNLRELSPRKALLQGSPRNGTVSSSKEEYARLHNDLIESAENTSTSEKESLAEQLAQELGMRGVKETERERSEREREAYIAYLRGGEEATGGIGRRSFGSSINDDELMREGFDGNSSLGSSLWGGGGGSAFGGAGVGGSVDEKARIAQLEMAMGEPRGTDLSHYTRSAGHSMDHSEEDNNDIAELTGGLLSSTPRPAVARVSDTYISLGQSHQAGDYGDSNIVDKNFTSANSSVDFSSVEDGGDATSEEGLNEPSLAREGFASETYTPRGTGMVHSSIVRDDIDDGKAFDLGVGKVNYASVAPDGAEQQQQQQQQQPADERNLQSASVPKNPVRSLDEAPLHFSIPLEQTPKKEAHSLKPPPVRSDYSPADSPEAEQNEQKQQEQHAVRTPSSEGPKSILHPGGAKRFVSPAKVRYAEESLSPRKANQERRLSLGKVESERKPSLAPVPAIAEPSPMPTRPLVPALKPVPVLMPNDGAVIENRTPRVFAPALARPYGNDKPLAAAFSPSKLSPRPSVPMDEDGDDESFLRTLFFGSGEPSVQPETATAPVISPRAVVYSPRNDHPPLMHAKTQVLQGTPQRGMQPVGMITSARPASFPHQHQWQQQQQQQQHHQTDGQLPNTGWLRATTSDLPAATRGSFDANYAHQPQTPLRHTSHDICSFDNRTDRLEWDSVRELQERVRANEQLLSAERARNQLSMGEGNEVVHQQWSMAPSDQYEPLAVNRAGSSNSAGSGRTNTSIQYLRSLTKQLEEQHAARTAMNMSNSIDVIAPEEVELYREAAMLAREALHEELRNSSHAVSLEDGALLPAFPRELEDVAPVGSVLPPGAEVEMQRLLHLHRVHEFRTRAEIARKQQKSAQAGFGHHHQTHEAAAAAAYAQAAAVAKGRNPLQSPDSEVLRSGLATAQAPPKHAISSVARELSMINHVDETADPADRLSMLLMQIKLGSGMRSGLNLPLKGGSSGDETDKLVSGMLSPNGAASAEDRSKQTPGGGFTRGTGEGRLEDDDAAVKDATDWSEDQRRLLNISQTSNLSDVEVLDQMHEDLARQQRAIQQAVKEREEELAQQQVELFHAKKEEHMLYGSQEGRHVNSVMYGSHEGHRASLVMYGSYEDNLVNSVMYASHEGRQDSQVLHSGGQHIQGFPQQGAVHQHQQPMRYSVSNDQANAPRVVRTSPPLPHSGEGLPFGVVPNFLGESAQKPKLNRERSLTEADPDFQSPQKMPLPRPDYTPNPASDAHMGWHVTMPVEGAHMPAAGARLLLPDVEMDKEMLC